VVKSSYMTIRRYILALAALAMAAALAAPATADQSFGTYSTAPVPTPRARPADPNINVDYVYYPCPSAVGTPGRFNPWDPRSTSRPSSPHMHSGGQSYGCSSSHHNRPQPRPSVRRIPLAKPT
jgi:hypothetical protein